MLVPHVSDKCLLHIEWWVGEDVAAGREDSRDITWAERTGSRIKRHQAREGHTEDVHGDPAESDQAPDPRGQANWLKLEMASD